MPKVNMDEVAVQIWVKMIGLRIKEKEQIINAGRNAAWMGQIIVDGALSGVPMNMNGVRGSIQIRRLIDGQGEDECAQEGKDQKVTG